LAYINFQWAQWLQDQPLEFYRGVGFGMIAAVVLAIVLRLLVWLLFERRRQHGICISGDNGDLVISMHALRDFVARVLTEFPDAALRQVKLRDRRNQLDLTLHVDLVPGSGAMPLRDQIRVRIGEELADKVGVDNCTVHVHVKGWNAKPSKGRGSRLNPPALPSAPSSESSAGSDDEPWSQ